MNRFIVLLTLSLLACLANAAPAKPACGASTSSKEINLLNPANPPRECVYHIKAYSSSVCQLRIDFAWTLAEPSVPEADNDLGYARCVNDYFKVGDIELCGVETKNHIYVPLNRTAGTTTIDLTFGTAVRTGIANFPTANWDVSIKQLECPSGAAIRSVDASEEDLSPSARATITDGFWVAPPGCLQYYPQASGIATSFNYNRGLGIYPGNMNYAICFRRQTTTSALKLRALTFHLGAQYRSNRLMELDNYCYSNLRTADTHEDYVMVPQAKIQNTEIRATYFCGDSIDSDTIISSNPGPLMILFNSDDHYSQHEAGFYFTYTIE